MSMTIEQKNTAEAIVNVFETGKVKGRYNAVTVLQGDAGHLSYGRSQASLGSGSLYLLLRDYTNEAGAQFAGRLRPILERFRNKDFSLDTDTEVRALLREAGDDPVMQRVQDEFFDRMYWQRASNAAESCGLSLPLCTTIVYDSFIHGSFQRIRELVNGGRPASAAFSQEDWAHAYVQARKNWLSSGSPLLQRTVYRMEAFENLMDVQKKWQLELPLTVRGVAIQLADVAPVAETFEPARVGEEGAEYPVLELTKPYTRSDHVGKLQAALSGKGFRIDADNVFGPYTEVLVKQFQKSRGLKPDGIVGPVTWAELLRPMAAGAGR